MRAILLALFTFAFVTAVSESPAAALTTVPTKMNFQGRLTDSSGAIKPNGNYNMKLRLFTVASGGASVWTEDRLVSASQGVTVTNGLFSVQVGSISALSASLFASGDLYLEVELPTPATATTSSPVWTEGAMTPRNQMATSAYAYNAETLDGIDSAAFAQLGTGNVFSGSATFSGANSTSKLLVQTNGATDLFRADTTTSTVTLGTATNGSIFTATGVQFTGTARPTRTITLVPEYAGATFTPVSGSFNGSLSSDFCSGTSLLSINTGVCGATDEHNYYSWTTTQGSAQDYGVFVRYKVPSDYDTGSMTNLKFWGRGTTASELAGIVMYKGATACATLSDVVTSANTWAEGLVASPLGACTIDADDIITFKITLTATTSNSVRAGEISYTYRSKF